jgi:hypothetical protein
VVEIKEGSELDRVIAESIRLVIAHRVLGYNNMEFWSDPRSPSEVPRTFKPSTNLNNAFYAAEVIGVFNNYRMLRKNRLQWEVIEIGESLDRIISSGETPALAICAAVLDMGEANVRK